MSVISEERKRIIVEKIEVKGKVKVADLANEFAVSTETIRRYLEELDREQKLKKVYGGAVKAANSPLVEPSMIERKIWNIEQKKRIAYKAAAFIRDGDVLMIDEGSTTLQMVPYMLPCKNLTVITNSFALANQLISAINKKFFNGEILFIGGKVSSEHYRVAGPLSQQIMNQLHFEKAFISVDGVLPNFGLSCYDLENAKLSEKMIQQAGQTFVLADHSKIGVKATYQITNSKEIDYVLSNERLPEEWSDRLAKEKVEWVKC
ncbi:DeoR/GlpR family DNA-binding transcription regulator [Pseudobacillus wudalianchiensis]|uniref:DeoR/GlpR family DNA-binding transcription regulator n=1 Tax=Pseudobacillus wudalianchiensis TaxID=1743143 RepID=UPI00080870BA|nr:DeoR/GlpR family DNA-binding transcription regulator [Bacillus wudalianchiensis]